MIVRLNLGYKKNKPLILLNLYLHLTCIKYTTNHICVMQVTFL